MVFCILVLGFLFIWSTGFGLQDQLNKNSVLASLLLSVKTDKNLTCWLLRAKTVPEMSGLVANALAVVVVEIVVVLKLIKIW